MPKRIVKSGLIVMMLSLTLVVASPTTPSEAAAPGCAEATAVAQAMLVVAEATCAAQGLTQQCYDLSDAACEAAFAAIRACAPLDD